MLRTRSPVRPLSLADRDDALDVCSRDLPRGVFVAARVLEGSRTGSLSSVLGHRVDGELTSLLTRGVSAGNRASDVLELRDHRIAVETAILRMKSGSLLVVQAEDGDAEASLALVRSLLPSPSAEVSS